jgi:uncharacterized protein (TIGR03546 family)
MVWLKILAKLLRVLKDGATPAQIALGFVLGWAIGMIPGWPVQVWLLVLLLLVLQANLSMALVGMAVAAALSWIFDPALDALGGAVLTAGPLQGLFTGLYNSPPWGLTRFNNTIVMGGMLVALVTGSALFPLVVRGVRWYRERLLARMDKWRLVQVLKSSRLYGWYQRLHDLGLA